MIKMRKREDYINWDEYFMGIAQLSGMRSKDPHTQVGACIVSPDNKILSMGYNGFPIGCSDDEFPWDREGEFTDTKYPYVTHGEMNAILNYRGGSLEGTKLYVSLFPCNECAKAIIQHLDSRYGRTACCQHGVYHKHFSFCTVCGKLAVIFYRV